MIPHLLHQYPLTYLLPKDINPLVESLRNQFLSIFFRFCYFFFPIPNLLFFCHLLHFHHSLSFWSFLFIFLFLLFLLSLLSFFFFFSSSFCFCYPGFFCFSLHCFPHLSGIKGNSHLSDLSIGSMKHKLSQKIKLENGLEIVLHG